MNYYLLIGFGRRLDNGQYDYVIAKNSGGDNILYSHREVDNIIYRFRLELEQIFHIDDDFRIDIKKFILNKHETN